MASVRVSAFPGRLVPPDSGRIQSGILCYLGGPERSREGGVRGCFWSSAESKAGRAEPASCRATAPRSSSSEAAVSTTRHSPRAAGKCGRVCGGSRSGRNQQAMFRRHAAQTGCVETSTAALINEFMSPRLVELVTGRGQLLFPAQCTLLCGGEVVNHR